MFKRDLDAGLIKDQSVVYIKDKRIIYTHGTEYNGSIGSGSDIDVITNKDLSDMGIERYV